MKKNSVNHFPSERRKGTKISINTWPKLSNCTIRSIHKHSGKSNQANIKKWKLQTRLSYLLCLVCFLSRSSSSIYSGMGIILRSHLLLFFVLLSLLIPKGQKKYNNTEMKSGQHFAAATQHLTPAFVKIKIVKCATIPIKIWKLQTWFYWVCSWEIVKRATSLTPPSTGFHTILISGDLYYLFIITIFNYVISWRPTFWCIYSDLFLSKMLTFIFFI